jgi:phosphoribosyl-ATP pyrophosphohydrolase
MDVSSKKRPLNPEAQERAEPYDVTVYEFEQHVKRSRLRRFGFDYLILGVIEEAGEVARATQNKRPSTDCSDVANELGDVLWYATALRLELGDEPLASWPAAAEARTEHPPTTEHAWPHPVQLLLLASELAGRAKKAIRGDKPLDTYLPEMRRYVREILECCAEVASTHKLTLQRCALMNVRKLDGRKRRGSITGDGNDR